MAEPLDYPSRVAVVIPCHNHACFLPAAVASVVGQTFHDWEILIVDDGSTDNSAEVAERLIERFRERRIRLLRQANAGQGAARNRAIASTNAPFILTLDADDMLQAAFLEQTLAVIERDNNIGFVTTNARFFGVEETLWSGGPPTNERMLFDCRSLAEVLFRRDAWQAVGGYEKRRESQGYEDWDFWLRLIEHGWRGELVPETLCWYRRSPSSALTKATPRDLRFRALLVADHATLYPAAFQPWAHTVLQKWGRAPRWHWWLWFAWYALLVARFAPRELPKTLVRPAFKALGPHLQMYARRLARLLGLSRTR